MKEWKWCIIINVFILLWDLYMFFKVDKNGNKYISTIYDVFSKDVFMRSEMVIDNYMWIYYMTINLLDNITIYNENRYNKTLSTPIQLIHLNGMDIPVKQANEKLSFIGEDSFNFTFFNIAQKKLDMFTNEDISFALRPSNKIFSFMYQLQKANLINSLIMYLCSIKYHKTENDVGGTIYFGGINSSLIENKHSITIKPLPNVNEWKVNMNQFKFHIIDKENILNEKIITFSNTKEVIFDIGMPYIYVPYDEYEKFREVYFRNTIEMELCKEEEIDKVMLFNCKPKGLRYLGNVEFVIDYNVFSFNIKDLLETYEMEIDENDKTSDYFLISIYLIKHNENRWIFGEEFFRNYISCLDFEKEEIRFYANDSFDIVKEIKVQINTVWFMIIMLSISIIYLIIIKYTSIK